MKLYYDFHIHSALSPCGAEDMTPNNIVNMSFIKELNAIAITDHNAVANSLSAMQVAKDNGMDILVIPAAEVETAEEIHIVCLFRNGEKALEFQEYIWQNLPKIKNRTDIFGEQTIYDSEDNPVKIVSNLLGVATNIDLETLVKKVRELGGIAIPAHVDRPSFSLLSNLGFLPENLGIKLVEISKYSNPKEFLSENKKLLGQVKGYIQSSDAHDLYNINEAENFIEVKEFTIDAIIDSLEELNL